MDVDFYKVANTIGKTAQLQVLISLMNEGEDTASGIALKTGLSHSSVSRVLIPMVHADIVSIRKVGKDTPLYQVNDDSEILRDLRGVFRKITKNL